MQDVTNLTPAKTIKASGIPTIGYILEQTNGELKRQTFLDWFDTKPELFKLVVEGAVMRFNQEKADS